MLKRQTENKERMKAERKKERIEKILKRQIEQTMMVVEEKEIYEKNKKQMDIKPGKVKIRKVEKKKGGDRHSEVVEEALVVTDKKNISKGKNWREKAVWKRENSHRI